VDSADELSGLWKTAQAEAQASFGSGEILIEKYVERPRHVEIQIIGDQHGNVVFFGERECSIQNLRHQKIVEEAPFADLPDAVRQAMGESAVRVSKSVGYFNAGTVEFLVDPDFNFYFLEMNTRLQVEHPVTEEIAGIDLVHTMLRVASGEKLPFTQAEVRLRGHSIEARVTAQDPDQDFAPSTGQITQWRAPSGRGVRMETHCYAGFTVTPFYDPLLAKLIVTAPDRSAAVAKLAGALREFEVEGIATNIPFLRRLVATDRYRQGDFDTGFVPEFLRDPA
jgi:acetyl-CoA carboxylase biotin carboxylase subunit